MGGCVLCGRQIGDHDDKGCSFGFTPAAPPTSADPGCVHCYGTGWVDAPMSSVERLLAHNMGDGTGVYVCVCRGGVGRTDQLEQETAR